MTQAARGRQVRRRLLHGLRRPAWRRRLGGQRAGRAAGRRGRPGRAHLGRPASAAASPASSPRPARTPTSPGSPGCASSAGGGEADHRDQDQVLAGPAGVHQGRQVQLRRAGRAVQADRLPGAGPDHQRPRGARGGSCPPWPLTACRTARYRQPPRAPARGVPLRRRHQRVLRAPGLGRAGHRRAAADRIGALHRDRAGAGRPRAHDPDRGRARAGWSTWRSSGGPAMTRWSARS